jgi:hypothetical protein
MDGRRFDHLAIAVSQRTTRRAALGLLTAVGLTGLVSEEARAACSGPGKRCGRSGDRLCCSGICKRKRGSRKKFCKASANDCTGACGDTCADFGLCLCMTGGGTGAGVCTQKTTTFQPCPSLGCPNGQRCIQACDGIGYCLTPCN